MAPSNRSIWARRTLRRCAASSHRSSSIPARPGGDKPARGGRTASSRDRSGSIRAWAQAQGITVSAQGRIPANSLSNTRPLPSGPDVHAEHRRPGPIRAWL